MSRGGSRGIDEGLAAGLEEGRAAGHGEAMASHAEALTALEDGLAEALAEVIADRREMARDARQAVLTLAVRLSEKVVHRAIDVEPERVVDQMRDAVTLVLDPQRLRLHIHPKDRPIIEEALPAVLTTLADQQQIELVEDETVISRRVRRPPRSRRSRRPNRDATPTPR